MFFLKDDRSSTIDDFNREAGFYQYLFNDKIMGSLGDINPATDTEMDLLTARVERIAPDVVGVSARTATMGMARAVVGRLRRVLPRARYIGGGYGPTAEPEKFLEFLDVVCLGEGERVVADLAAAEDPTTVANAAWMEDGRLRHNRLAPPVNLDDDLWPDWSPEDKFLIEDDAATPIADCYDTKTYDIFTTRGCPNRCTYCMASHWNRTYKHYGTRGMPRIRLRSPESVIAELEHAKEAFGICRVYFKDSIFGFSRKWFDRFMDLYDRRIGVPFICFLEPNFTDERRVKRLKASGMDKTTVGIQAACESVRKTIMGRTSTDDDLVAYAEMLIANGVGIHYDIMHWNPFDTRETLEAGVRFLKRLPKGEDVVVSQTHIFPGSRLDGLQNVRRPEPLPFDTYVYYAWLFQMILCSRETEALAEMAMDDPAYARDPSRLQALFRGAIAKMDTEFGIAAARNIEKGEMVTSVMIERFKTQKRSSLAWDEKHRVLTRIARRTIPRGGLIRPEDFFGKYDYKYEG
ncbi:MAG: cobalamin-dependent protein [Desulfobacterales bacterium]|nr:cobalamin-dependent protein [Desulfobacterales bacterium]